MQGLGYVITISIGKCLGDTIKSLYSDSDTTRSEEEEDWRFVGTELRNTRPMADSFSCIIYQTPPCLYYDCLAGRILYRNVWPNFD